MLSKWLLILELILNIRDSMNKGVIFVVLIFQAVFILCSSISIEELSQMII
jgi:hypothetical protein